VLGAGNKRGHHGEKQSSEQATQEQQKPESSLQQVSIKLRGDRLIDFAGHKNIQEPSHRDPPCQRELGSYLLKSVHSIASVTLDPYISG
jgi:hypothetical protein